MDLTTDIIAGWLAGKQTHAAIHRQRVAPGGSWRLLLRHTEMISWLYAKRLLAHSNNVQGQRVWGDYIVTLDVDVDTAFEEVRHFHGIFPAGCENKTYLTRTNSNAKLYR